MADNVEVGPYTYAADEVGQVKFVLVKLDGGGDGVSVPIIAESGRVPVASSLAAGAATDAKQDTAQARFDALASEAKLEAVRTLLAGTLTTGLPTGAATDAKSEAIRALLAGSLTVDSELSAAAALADGQALPTAGKVGAVPQLYNGATLDLQRGNTDVIALAQAVRTGASHVAPIQTNHNALGMLFVLRFFAVGAGTVTVNIRDSTNEVIHPFAAFTPLVGSYLFNACPGAIDVDGASKYRSTSKPIPRTWWPQVTHSDATAAHEWSGTIRYQGV
ncbi:MAG: hypothetical protein ACR2ML_01080 [Solirubrobacteraceae bacterium]